MRVFIIRNNSINFSVERVNFKMGIEENEKASESAGELGSIRLKNCTINSNSKAVYLKGSVKAINIQNCAINITNSKTYAVDLLLMSLAWS